MYVRTLAEQAPARTDQFLDFTQQHHIKFQGFKLLTWDLLRDRSDCMSNCSTCISLRMKKDITEAMNAAMAKILGFFFQSKNPFFSRVNLKRSWTCQTPDPDPQSLLIVFHLFTGLRSAALNSAEAQARNFACKQLMAICWDGCLNCGISGTSISS